MPRIKQMELVVAITTHLGQQGIKSGEPQHLNAIIKAADGIVEAFGTEPVMATANMGAQAWLASDDTGTSSRYLLQETIAPQMMPQATAWPADPSDFGRCIRLMEAVPLVREKLSWMAVDGGVWKNLVENWPELENLYREELPTGKAPKLYVRMKEIGC